MGTFLVFRSPRATPARRSGLLPRRATMPTAARRADRRARVALLADPNLLFAGQPRHQPQPLVEVDSYVNLRLGSRLYKIARRRSTSPLAHSPGRGRPRDRDVDVGHMATGERA